VTGGTSRGRGPVVVLAEAPSDGAATPSLLELVEEAVTVAAALQAGGPSPAPDDSGGGDWDGGGPEPQPAVEVWVGGWPADGGPEGPGADEDLRAALAQAVGAHGAGRLRLFPAAPPDAGFDPEVAATGWAPALAAVRAPLALATDAAPMRECLPRLALRLGAPAITAALEVRVRQGGIEVLRSRDSGLRMERCRYPAIGAGDPPPTSGDHAGDRGEVDAAADGAAPVLVAMTGGLRGALAPDPERCPATIAFDPAVADASPGRVRVVGRRPPRAESVDIAEADRIVAGGAGIASPDNVAAYLERLARALGAAVGGTRVISDRGWIPHERYIGSTGKTVSPELYLALGISGASQHVVGIKDAGTIVAINQDRTAPMVGLADLALIGDVHEVAPALAARLEARARRPDEPARPIAEAASETPPSSAPAPSEEARVP